MMAQRIWYLMKCYVGILITNNRLMMKKMMAKIAIAIAIAIAILDNGLVYLHHRPILHSVVPILLYSIMMPFTFLVENVPRQINIIIIKIYGN